MIPANEIVGRAPEIEGLAAFLDGVPQGPAALHVEGPAGIGKTILLSWLQEQALNRSFRVLACRPGPSEVKLSYGGLSDLIEPVMAEVQSMLPDPQRRALDIALMRADGAGKAPDQRAISTAFLASLRALSNSAPLLVVVDDAQWLDSPTARVLEFAARRFEREPVGLVATMRGDRGQWPVVAWADSRSLSTGQFVRIDVGPLGIDELDRVLRLRLGLGLSHPILVQVHRTAGGNPFFALEIARAIQRRQDPPKPGEPLPVPNSLTELVRDRLATLSSSTREVLLAASAQSQPTVSAAKAVAGDRAEPALVRAVGAAVIEIDGDRIFFTHPLLSSVIYSTASPDGRRQAHRRLAEVIRDPEECARHLALATMGTDESVAVALDAAARTARSRGAPDAAAELFELACRLTPSERPDDRYPRMSSAADCWFEAGDGSRAGVLLEEVIRGVPAGPQRVESLLQLARVRWYDEGDRIAFTVLEQALGEVGDDLRLRARVERAMAWALMQEDKRLAAQHAQAGLEAAEQLGDPALLALLLSVAAWCDFSLGRGISHDLWERALALEEAVRGLPLIMWPSCDYAPALICADEFDRAFELLQALRAQAIERGDESAAPLVLDHLSQLATLRGEWNRAVEYAQAGFDIAQQGGQEKIQADLLTDWALAEAHLGLVDQARERAERSLVMGERSEGAGIVMMSLHALGFIELSLGSATEAHRFLGRAVQILPALGIEDPGLCRFIADDVEALVAAGELDSAKALLDPFEERARKVGRASALAAAARCRGLIAATAGQVEEAVAHLQQAIDGFERLPMPFELGRTLLVLGTVQRRAKGKKAARQQLNRALEIFERLGARIWAERTRGELARISGRAPGPAGLTPTEQRVAELVAAGKTNPEVAKALFMSRKTVEANLHRIYAKLGVRNRGELAALYRSRPPAE